MTILFLQIAIVLATAHLARKVTVPLGQPGVVGEIIAGVMLGPSLLGWLFPTLAQRLFAPETLPLLNALSQVGLVLFMFLVGLRVDAHRIDARRTVAMITSASSIIAPFALGAWLAASVHHRLAPSSIGIVPFALFFGAAMSITAFPVLARILIDEQLFRTELGVLAITCAAFDDVTGWLILAGITALVRAEGSAALLVTRLGLFLGYLAIMTLAIRPALQRFARSRRSEFGASANDLAAVLLLLLLSAATTEALGVHALFGAFLAGLIAPRDARLERIFEERVEPLTMTLLLPLFFAFTGLRTNVQLLHGAAMWIDTALILLVAITGKAGASAIAARAMGITWRDATTLGVLLNTRGLVELIVLNVGLDLGILSPAVFTMLVIMAIVTTLMTSPLVRILKRPAVDDMRETGAHRKAI